MHRVLLCTPCREPNERVCLKREQNNILIYKVEFCRMNKNISLLNALRFIGKCFGEPSFVQILLLQGCSIATIFDTNKCYLFSKETGHDKLSIQLLQPNGGMMTTDWWWHIRSYILSLPHWRGGLVKTVRAWRGEEGIDGYVDEADETGGYGGNDVQL